MTEEEAKAKWCPHARVGSEQSGLGSINRDVRAGETVPQSHCIGSACTAWRWGRATSDAPSSIRYPGDTGAAADAHGFWYRDGKPIGFCGLAGRPA